jgi:hypothetical protein
VGATSPKTAAAEFHFIVSLGSRYGKVDDGGGEETERGQKGEDGARCMAPSYETRLLVIWTSCRVLDKLLIEPRTRHINI